MPFFVYIVLRFHLSLREHHFFVTVHRALINRHLVARAHASPTTCEHMISPLVQDRDGEDQVAKHPKPLVWSDDKENFAQTHAPEGRRRT